MSFWGDDFFERRKTGRTSSRRGAAWGGRHWFLPSLLTFVLVVFIAVMLLPFVMGQDHARTPQLAIPVLAQDAIQDYNRRIIQVVDQVTPTVVSVINHPVPLEADKDGADADYFGLGSGIIFAISKERALVVTNHHVIDGGAGFEVVLANGERRPAELIGSDRFTDLAVMSIAGKGITHVATFGDSDLLEKGESVIAIGNPLGISYSQTITAGIISSLRTPVQISLAQDGQIDWEVEFIQTDAAINRGNSGGALVNLKGEVIGINSMKVSDFGVEGLGFAIPINEAIEVMQSLLKYGKVKRPFIGVATQDLSLYRDSREHLKLPDDVEQGVIIISAEGPAAEAGLKTGDVIVKLDDNEIDSMLALRKYLYMDKAIGDVVEVTFYRENKRKTVDLKLVEREEK